MPSRHGDAVDREPELAVAEIERQRLGARRGHCPRARSGSARRSPSSPGSPRRPGGRRRPQRGRPVAIAAARFHVRIDAAPVDEEHTVTDRGEHARGLRPLVCGAVQLRVVDRDRGAARDVERELDLVVDRRPPVRSQPRLIAPNVRPRACSGTTSVRPSARRLAAPDDAADARLGRRRTALREGRPVRSGSRCAMRDEPQPGRLRGEVDAAPVGDAAGDELGRAARASSRRRATTRAAHRPRRGSAAAAAPPAPPRRAKPG